MVGTHSEIGSGWASVFHSKGAAWIIYGLEVGTSKRIHYLFQVTKDLEASTQRNSWGFSLILSMWMQSKSKFKAVISETVRCRVENPRRALKADFLGLGTACSSIYGSVIFWTNQDLKSGSWSSTLSLITHWESHFPSPSLSFPICHHPAQLKGFWGWSYKRKDVNMLWKEGSRAV